MEYSTKKLIFKVHMTRKFNILSSQTSFCGDYRRVFYFLKNIMPRELFERFNTWP